MAMIVMLTEEDFCQLSRPEAIAMYRQIMQMIQDAYDVGAAEAACECTCEPIPFYEVLN